MTSVSKKHRDWVLSLNHITIDSIADRISENGDHNIITWLKDHNLLTKYTTNAIDLAAAHNHVHILDEWFKTG